MTTTDKDAVEALAKAINMTVSFQYYPERDANHFDKANAVAQNLASLGFTLTRPPVMTDEELEREAEKLCTATDEDWRLPTVRHYMTKEAAMALAKKYRG